MMLTLLNGAAGAYPFPCDVEVKQDGKPPLIQNGDSLNTGGFIIHQYLSFFSTVVATVTRPCLALP